MHTRTGFLLLLVLVVSLLSGCERLSRSKTAIDMSNEILDEQEGVMVENAGQPADAASSGEMPGESSAAGAAIDTSGTSPNAALSSNELTGGRCISSAGLRTYTPQTGQNWYRIQEAGCYMLENRGDLACELPDKNVISAGIAYYCAP